MKIDGKSAPINLEAKRLQKSEAKSAKIEKAEVAKGDSVDTRLSSALQNVLKGISDSGLSAGEVHSNVSEKTVERLLNESPVQAVRPKLSNEALLALTNKVADSMLADPHKALEAFSEIKGARVAELL